MEILKPTDDRLYQTCTPVTDIRTQVLAVLHEMRETMEGARHGIALSAPQVGIMRRFFITNGRHLPSVVINPEVLSKSDGMQIDREGCLSFPGMFTEISRPYSIRVRFTNIKGVLREDEFAGFSARIFMHEFDHMDGKTIFPRPAIVEATQ